MALRVRVTVWRDGHQLDDVSFDGREHRLIKIGALATAHITIHDRSVHRMHAVIEVSSDKVTVTDLGTLDGTLVNQEPVRKAELHNGDVLTIGETSLQVSIQPLLELPLPLPKPVREPVTIWRMQETPLAAVPAPDGPPDVMLPGQRNVGPDWQVTDYVAKEKYDTRHLVVQMQKQKRRSNAGALAIAGCVLALVLLPISMSRGVESQVRARPLSAQRVLKPPVAEPVMPKAPRTYLIRRGDTLGSIAQQQLGDTRLWRHLWRANQELIPDPSRVAVGLEIVLPGEDSPI